MKKIVLLALSFGLLSISCKSDKQTQSNESVITEVTTSNQKKASPEAVEFTHTVDLRKSKLLWKGHKPTGLHNGTVNLKEGGVSFKGNQLLDGSFVFDMTSIIALDMPQDDEYNQKLIKHLKSPDFFDTQAHPTAFFIITNVLTDASQTNITGDLTIKEITKQITFPVTISEKDGGLQLTAATFLIDRTDFNIQYKSKKFFDNLKDKFINDEFEIAFNVYLK